MAAVPSFGSHCGELLCRAISREGRVLLITDLRELPSGSPLQSDLCIVGSGPAGLTLAAELAHSGFSILVLESGGASSESAFAASLNEIESVGAPRVMEQARVRNRVLGGASHTWSGRCAPLDAIDYRERPWVPFSGWPIQPSDIEPLLPKAAQYLGLIPVQYNSSLFGELRLQPRFDGNQHPDLRAAFWQFSRTSGGDYVRFGPRFRALDSPNLRVLTHATATHLNTSENGARVETLEIASPDGARHMLSSRFFLLCGGGIENARMLLASNRRQPRGVGNTKDQVGRFLMDHPRATIGVFAPEAVPRLQREFLLVRHRSGARIQRGFALSFDVQQKEELLNCAAWLTLHVAENDVWQILGGLRRERGTRRLRRAGAAVRGTPQILAGTWGKLRGHPLPRRFKKLDLDVTVEQSPNPDSRVTLAERRDALGVPLSRIDWRIGERERRSVIRLGHAIRGAFEQDGLPAPELARWIHDKDAGAAVFHDPAHPMGATRMAVCSCHGVVDRNQKVFGIDNLYIAGSSVFPTGGHANPTLMIVALSLRLAERLRDVMAAPVR